MKKVYILISLITNLSFANDFDETKLQFPYKDVNEQSLGPTLCKTRDHLRWDICFNYWSDDLILPKSIRFMNHGENVIVPKSGFGIGRSFEFMFEDLARSDLGLLVWDSPDEYESHGHLKLMMFFPRKYMFRANYISNENVDHVIITLPTGEDVVFNGKTYEIVSGVLSESPITSDEEGNALEPKVNYTGSGVVLWAHKLNNYPVGHNDSAKKDKAFFYKKGFPICTINSSDLWHTNSDKNENVMFRSEYSTDLALDIYLKKKCKFSMF